MHPPEPYKFHEQQLSSPEPMLNITNSSNPYVLNSSFCSASAIGLSIQDSNSELDGNVFENLGNSGAGGGALRVNNSIGSWVSVKRSNFSHNFVGGEGGALHMTGWSCYFENNRFINNTSGNTNTYVGNGGAVLMNLEKAAIYLATVWGQLP